VFSRVEAAALTDLRIDSVGAKVLAEQTPRVVDPKRAANIQQQQRVLREGTESNQLLKNKGLPVNVLHVLKRWIAPDLNAVLEHDSTPWGLRFATAGEVMDAYPAERTEQRPHALLIAPTVRSDVDAPYFGSQALRRRLQDVCLGALDININEIHMLQRR
jgi:hypothetical protein